MTNHLLHKCVYHTHLIEDRGKLVYIAKFRGLLSYVKAALWCDPVSVPSLPTWREPFYVVMKAGKSEIYEIGVSVFNKHVILLDDEIRAISYGYRLHSPLLNLHAQLRNHDCALQSSLTLIEANAWV